MPLDYPENLTPFASPYVFVAINEAWFSLVWGVLQNALLRKNWTVSDAEWLDVEQAVMELLDIMTSGCDPCGISISISASGELIMNLSPEISIETGIVVPTNMVYDAESRKWTFNVGDTEYSYSDISNVYPQIDTSVPVPNYDETIDPLDHICAGVTQLVLWLIDVWTDEVAQTQLYLDGAKTIREAVTGIVEFISGGVAELMPIDEVWGFVQSMAQLELDLASQVLNSVTFKDDIGKALYCRILANGGTLNETIFNAWAQDVLEIGGLPPLDWRANLIDVIGWHRVVSKYSLYSLDVENDCRVAAWCGLGSFELTEDWNGSGQPQGWEIEPGGPGAFRYDEPQGWEALVAGYPWKGVRAQEIYTISGVLASIEWRIAQNTPGTDTWVEIYEGADLIWQSDVMHETSIEVNTAYPNLIFSGDHIIRIVLSLNASPTPAHNSVIEFCILRGTGSLEKEAP